jgi:hypothetical protein
MKPPNDNHIPTAIADQPGQTPAGDYLAPPHALKLPDSRILPIMLLCATLLFNGMYLLILQLNQPYEKVNWRLILPVSGGLLILQFFAIFRSHKWPTFALWLALAVVLAGFFIGF